MSRTLFGAIADDLTGAVELAGMLSAGGARATVATDVAAVDGDADAVVCALRSRVAPAQTANRAFQDATDRLSELGVRQIFFKYCATFDSTDQGNIGNCADILTDATNARTVLFCPAFPEVNNTVYTGHLFTRGQLVSESPKRFDPLTPMLDPNLVRVLARQTSRPVDLAPWSVVSQGPDILGRWLDERAKAGGSYFIVDAISEADLQTIALATWDLPAMTGGSSVAAYYPAIWREQGLLEAGARAPAPGRSGPGAVLCGSVADRTLEQIAVFEESGPVLTLDLLEEGDVAGRALDWAQARLGDGPVCISTSTGVERTKFLQGKLGVEGAARRAEALLSAIGKGLVERGVERLLVAGGETSGAVVEALALKRLAASPYRAPGIGLCQAEDHAPLSLCLKSGKLGARDMFPAVLAEMEKPH